MLGKAIKSLFGGKQDADVTPAKPTGPFGLGLGYAARLDLMKLSVARAALAMPPMPEQLAITGHGRADMGDGTVLHRLYSDENVMLQVICADGVGPESIREVMILHPWDSVIPQTDAEWRQWDGPTGTIGAATFAADGLTFQRHWGDPSEAWIAPVEFVEDVLTDEGTKRIHQKVVSYRRPIQGTDEHETLLITVERDLSSHDRGSVSFMIGYDLSPVDITAV